MIDRQLTRGWIRLNVWIQRARVGSEKRSKATADIKSHARLRHSAWRRPSADKIRRFGICTNIGPGLIRIMLIDARSNGEMRKHRHFAVVFLHPSYHAHMIAHRVQWRDDCRHICNANRNRQRIIEIRIRALYLLSSFAHFPAKLRRTRYQTTKGQVRSTITNRGHSLLNHSVQHRAGISSAILDTRKRSLHDQQLIMAHVILTKELVQHLAIGILTILVWIRLDHQRLHRQRIEARYHRQSIERRISNIDALKIYMHDAWRQRKRKQTIRYER
mmetsp:Transcript_41250/g.67852  ORF Transcript_41250/g.67852 Transcript_41250/m.67852 type:complete len:274 (-) Transcript_41250:866-1687(-)